jgi:23S rRNA pseudouridine2605 synthase
VLRYPTFPQGASVKRTARSPRRLRLPPHDLRHFYYDSVVKARKTLRRIGLARAMSKLGYCSRSQAATLIRAGRVRLNGKVRHDPETPVLLPQDRIQVDDRSIAAAEKTYLVMNKPQGLITTSSDEKGRATIYSLLHPPHTSPGGDGPANALPWVGAVGRLDKASEGLLLLTNDSEWGARIADPATHLEKIYHVQVDRHLDAGELQLLVRGVESGGETLRARDARLLRSGTKNCWLEIVLAEGRNRQIRRMLQAMNLEVLRLVRVAIGPLQLGLLPKGAVRPLTREEKHLLDEAMVATLPRHES